MIATTYTWSRLLSQSSPIIKRLSLPFWFFFFNDTATTEIYTLSLHDALPISGGGSAGGGRRRGAADCTAARARRRSAPGARDRKSTRLNSSHSQISYAVFCLKKKIHSEAKKSLKWIPPTTGAQLHFPDDNAFV